MKFKILNILFFTICSFLLGQDYSYQKIDTIIINGNKKTKDYIIQREILHPIDMILDSSTMIQDINRLYNLGIFSTVVSLLIILELKWSNSGSLNR